MMKKIFIFLLVIASTDFASAMDLKKLTVFGKDCQKEIKDLQIQLTPDDRIKVPLRLTLEKNTASIVRKICQFTLPLEPKPNEKIQITGFRQKINLSADKETTVAASTEVFFAGHDSKPIKTIAKEEDLTKEIINDELIAESKCGESVILRGAVNVTTSGVAKGKARIEDIVISLKVLNCAH